jgi:virginiamycin B lyase
MKIPLPDWENSDTGSPPGGFTERRRRLKDAAVFLLPILGLFILLTAGAGAVHARPVLGGARGVVHNVNGEPIEGIGVQLVSSKTAIRTTVYTSHDGRYEFPLLETGQYTLRVARPLEYQPYVKEGVQINGATQLDEIVLQRVSETEFLPPTPEILAQLTGSEWLLNIPGTGEEKRVFSLTCGFGCHSYQQIFRNRYDERSWRIILQRMFRGSGSPLINMSHPTPQSLDRAGRSTLQDEEFLTKWLSTVRGPDSKDAPLYYLPRPTGASTRVIITEYELPRELLAPHDVHGDSMGRIWYTAHRSPYAGVLDPRTGKVTEYRIPDKDQDTPGVLPGTHRVWVDKNDIVWFSENWDHYLTGLDAKTGKIVHRFKIEGGQNNSSAFSNFAMDDAGYVYDSRGDGVRKIDSRTGEVVQKWFYKKIRNTYDSIITPDGRYWAGAPGGRNLVGLLDTKTGQLTEVETGTDISAGSRGGFDPDENVWIGGRGGMLIKADPRSHRTWMYYSPVPYDTFYEAMPDKNGEVWAGGLQSGRFMRFNPKTEKWTVYLMPEPYAHDRRTWIDNSTDPVTVWYVDHQGYMVRIQPLE